MSTRFRRATTRSRRTSSSKGAAEVLDFVKEAFGAEEKFRMDAPNGKIGHAEVKIGDSIVMVGRCRRGEPGHACR